MQKYKLEKFEIKNINGNEKKLYRIKALKDFSDVKTGEIGGLVESENNLSQEGSCWIYGDAIVIENALVQGNARITSNATISKNALIDNDAVVGGHASVTDISEVYENAYVGDNAKILGASLIGGYSRCLEDNVFKNKKLEYKLTNEEKEKLKEQTVLMEEMFGEDINTVLHDFRLDHNKDNTLTKLIDLFKVLEKLEK